MWVGTEGGGINLYKGGEFKAYTTKDGLSSNNVVSVYGDREGSLWIGTFDGGMNRFKNGKFTTYKQKDGLSGLLG